MDDEDRKYPASHYKSGEYEWIKNCPDCEHPDERHIICRDCPQDDHAMCVGTTKHPKNPTMISPCHCTWMPGARKDAPLPIERIKEIARDANEQILGMF